MLETCRLVTVVGSDKSQGTNQLVVYTLNSFDFDERWQRLTVSFNQPDV